MPRLQLLRHGIAEAAGDDPPLSEHGLIAMQAEARGLAALGMQLDRILTSPLRRARQTAAAVAEALGLEDRLEVAPALEPGCRLEDLTTLLKGRRSLQSILLVGHQPDLGGIAAELIGSHGSMPLDRGAMICLTVAGWPPRPPAKLERLLSPSFLQEQGAR